MSVDELRHFADCLWMDWSHYRPYESLDYMESTALAATCPEQEPGYQVSFGWQ